ncbi:leucine-rich repeat domain-containing protein [Candidatus Palauibacter sp.]|uniref:leucine-rich repeat domain-containing protein n=1 Tax=Candidatus Palauibacter sp. TaxID=3101350 RepID=UPI003C705C8E
MKSARRRVSKAEALKVAAVLAAVAACDSGEVAGPPSGASLVIGPDSAALTYLGETVRFTARVTGGTGAAGAVEWSSTDESVVTVDGAGLVTARGNGTAEVRATSGGLRAAASVAVEQRASALEVFGGGQRAQAGLPLPERAGVQVLDAGGAPVGGRAVAFAVTSGGGSVSPASVESNGGGAASPVWTLGDTPGEQRLAASVAGGPAAEIRATALDPDSAVAAIELQFGGGQRGFVGRPLPREVWLRVVDGADRPIEGALVRFVPESGSVHRDSVRSTGSGRAWAVWTLGETPGEQRLVATAGRARLEVTATALDPDSAVAAVVLRQGGGQSGFAGQRLPAAVGVRVLDGADRPIEGALVRFVPESGSVHRDSVRSLRDGWAAVGWTLGRTPGEQRLEVTAGGARLEVTATALASAVATVELRSWDVETAVAGQSLPVEVWAVDGEGDPVAVALVTFSAGPGGGSVRPDSAWSDGSGLASAVWTLGPTLGEQTLAVASGAARREVTVTAVDPDSTVSRVIPWSGNRQWGVVGHALAEAVVVQALDEAARPVPGALVNFVPEADGGSADPASARTDSSGLAATVWTLGAAEGGQALAVSLAGSARLEVTATAQLDAGICGRTQQVIQALLAKTGVASCANVTEEHLGRVTGLALRQKNITSLRSGDFAGLSRMHSLVLNDNRLRELPPDIFGGLDSLVTLRLRGNQLDALPPGLPSGLPLLNWLDLMSNRLTEIPSELAGLTNLTQLDLSDNPVTELPAGLFAGMPRLESLYLNGLELEELPPGIFAGLSELKGLHLALNRLRRLPAGVFSDLSSLAFLSLPGNRLTELPPGVFESLDALEVLSLTNNALASLDEATIAGLSGLRLLYLGGNALTDLPAGIFDGLSALELLSLENNEFSALPPDLFADLSRLLYLNLFGNRLSTLPPGIFAGLEALTNLRLQDNRLSALPPGLFAGLEALAILRLQGNGLSALPPGIFGDLESLKDLSLGINALAELPPGVFRGLRNLELLDLRRNPGAPFPVALELARTDAGDALAPGPAAVALRVPSGAPHSIEVSVTVQGGAASGGSLAVAAGETAGVPLEVARPSGSPGPVHVSLGLAPAFPPEFKGLEAVAGEPLVLFAPPENRTPVVTEQVPLHWLQAGVRSAEVDLGAHFSDPDGDTLVHEAGSSDAGVVAATVEGGVLVLEPLSEGSAVVEVTAADPGGLGAALSVPVTVARAPDPEGYRIELIFGDGFTEAEEAEIRRARARWEEVLAADVPDVPIDRTGFCRADLEGVRMVGSIDDVVIGVFVETENRASLASAAPCVVRESGLPTLGDVRFNRWYWEPDSLVARSDSMYTVALHEIGHVLGIGTMWRYRLRERTPYEGDPRDTHFPGPLAVEAFNEAGGWSYAGGKVPVENVLRLGANVHWRKGVLRGEVMAANGTALSAITLRALADLGYEVDVSRADPYELPALDRIPPPDVAAESEAWFADDVIDGPVVVVDENGNVVRIIRN